MKPSGQTEGVGGRKSITAREYCRVKRRMEEEEHRGQRALWYVGKRDESICTVG